MIGRGLLATLGERIAALRPGSKVAIVTDETVARHHLAAAEAALTAAGIGVVVASWCRPARAPRASPCSSGSATRCSPRRIERGDLVVALGGGVVGDLAGFAAGGGAARRRLRAGADDAAGAGRFLGRRQDRDQLPPRQEPGRRVPPADPGARRHRAARHAAAARIPRRLCRGGEIRAARRRGVLRLARSATGGTCSPAGRRAAIAAPREYAVLKSCRPRPRSSRATSARPATACCSISATPSAMPSRPPPASPTGCCTARRSRSAWRWRSSSRPGAG